MSDLQGRYQDAPTNMAHHMINLKTRIESSHNRDEEEQIIALVKFLARCAAEDDFEIYCDASGSHSDKTH